MKDQPDDPSHHERSLLPWSYIWLPVSEVALTSPQFLGRVQQFETLHGGEEVVDDVGGVGDVGRRLYLW